MPYPYSPDPWTIFDASYNPYEGYFGGDNGPLRLFDGREGIGGGGGGGVGFSGRTSPTALTPPSAAPSGVDNGSLASLLGSLDGQDSGNGLGDIFKTLLFLNGQRGGNGQQDAFSLFSGIQL